MKVILTYESDPYGFGRAGDGDRLGFTIEVLPQPH